MSFSRLLSAVVWLKIELNELYAQNLHFEVSILLNRCLTFALSSLHSLVNPSNWCSLVGFATLKKQSMKYHFGTTASSFVDCNQIKSNKQWANDLAIKKMFNWFVVKISTCQRTVQLIPCASVETFCEKSFHVNLPILGMMKATQFSLPEPFQPTKVRVNHWIFGIFCNEKCRHLYTFSLYMEVGTTWLFIYKKQNNHLL